MTLEEFAHKNLQEPEYGYDPTYEAKFWIGAFVKLVRERADRGEIYRDPKNCLYQAFNEIVKEFGLEDG